MTQKLTDLISLKEFTEKETLRIFHDIGMNVGEDEATPTWFCLDKDDKLIIAMTPWGSEFEKTITVELLRKKFKEDNVKAYAFVSEAWASTYSNEEVDDPNRIQPSQRDDRKEILSIVGQDLDDQRFFITYDIVLKDGKRRLENRFESKDANAMGGRMGTMLVEKKMRH